MRLSIRKIKRTAFTPVKAAVNSIDFEKVLKNINNSPRGRIWREKLGVNTPAFADQEEITRHAVELTMAELSARGEKVAFKDVDEYARSISCRYDSDIHMEAKIAAYSVLEHLFKHQDSGNLFLSGDHRELAHLEKLRRARRDNIGVIYLVNHSSHLDEFIVDVVLDQLGLGLPLFAAGANMMATPSLERILMTGSYLIIRKGATKLYLTTLFNYCRSLSELGKQQGIFLEAWAGGARTRDGGLRYPRRLVTLQGALASERDVLIQPVVISYNAVPEDLSLAERAGSSCWVNGARFGRSLLRGPYRPIRAAVRALADIYDRAYINFCQPRLLSELDEMRARDPGGLGRDEFVALYSMREIAREKKIMTSQLTARGILRSRREGHADLVTATAAELESLVDYHQRTFCQKPDLEDFIRQGSLEDVVDDGLRVLRRRKVVKGKAAGLSVIWEHGLQYYATHGDRRLYSPSAKNNIVVVGAGAWGYGMACLVGQRTLDDKPYLNSSLTLFDPRDDLVSGIVDTRMHPVHFPKVRLPKNVFPSSDAVEAFRKANQVVLTAYVDFFEIEVRRVLAEAPLAVKLIIATRGFEQTSHRLPIQIAEDAVRETGRDDVALLVLSGPITPKKLAEGLGGAMVLAGPSAVIRHTADLFKWPPFNVFVCNDPVGVQVAGTMAEVYTLLGAYLLRTKEMNGRGQVAMFIRETSEETMKLAVALGGRKDTFLPDNPAWVAEYVAAGMGGPSAQYGREAGKLLRMARLSASDFLYQSARDLREEGYSFIGYTGIRSAYLTAKRLNLEMPRLRQAYRIFWKD